MSDISNSELRRLDLTLLLVFLGLLRHRKATAVAAELGLTQSAVSQALRRLRDIFGDPLFLRRPHGLEPTAAALAREASVRTAVEALRQALGGGEAPFDPATARRVLKIAAIDAEQAILVPPLVKAATEEAPGVQIIVTPLARRAAIEALIEGEVDLATGVFFETPPALIATPLYRMGYAVVGRPEVLGAGPLTVERYAALPHILLSPGNDLRGIVDEALMARGLTRHVVAAVPAAFPALAAVARTRCIATLPDIVARAHAPAMGLAIADPPLPLRSFPVLALHHRRNETDGAVLWALAVLTRATA
ncbi:LysR substrate-binding domain-containing protein [Tabrizicola sp.]|uniref:LysR family transcriptional regulator n=1 Tax=Tabrizicola sp. TaxID=2005166 RepID=UPI003F3D94EC